MSTVSGVGYSLAVVALGRHPHVGRLAMTIDDDLHGRARALQVRMHPKVSWEQWVEAAIAAAVEVQEAERAEQDRKRRGR